MSARAADQRNLLYIDMAYTFEMVRRKGHEEFFRMRHSGGYFARVWGVHPLADVAGKASRKIEIHPFDEGQTIIEGVAESLPLPRLLLPVNFVISQFRLTRLLKKLVLTEKISLIYATDAFYSGLFGWFLKLRTRRPLIVAVFANQDDLYAATGALAMPRLLPFRFLEKLVCRLVLRKADLVVAGNRNNLNFALANGARDTAIIPVGKNIEQVHLVPPEERGYPDVLRRLDVKPGTPLMLFVGRLVALKHPDEAVRAMALVIRRYPKAIGFLAGDGPMRNEIEALVESLGMTGKIHLLGLLDQRALSELATQCITVSPLTGMALAECALAGSPIVAFDRDWQAEFVEDGVNGFVVPFLDHQAMADRTMNLIADPQLRARMGKEARHRGLEFADKERIQALEWAAYDRVLEKRR